MASRHPLLEPLSHRPHYSRSQSDNDQPRMSSTPARQAGRSALASAPRFDERQLKSASSLEPPEASRRYIQRDGDDTLRLADRKMYAIGGNEGGMVHSRVRRVPSERDLRSVIPQRPSLGPRRPSYSSGTSFSNSTDGRSSSKSRVHDDNELSWPKYAERSLHKRQKSRDFMRRERQELDDGLDEQKSTAELRRELAALESYLSHDIPGLREDEMDAATWIEEMQEKLAISARQQISGRSSSAALELKQAELKEIRRNGLRDLELWEDREKSESRLRMQELKKQLGSRIAQTTPKGSWRDVEQAHPDYMEGKGKEGDTPQVPGILVSTPQHDARVPARGVTLQTETVFSAPSHHSRSRSTGDIHSDISTLTFGSSVFESWVKIADAPRNENRSFHARAVADTGSHDNWIALDVLRRAGLEDQLQALHRPVRCGGVGGWDEARSTVELTISTVNTSYSRRIWFYVLRNPPFDMVLGRRFIKENAFAYASPALIFQKPKRNKGTKAFSVLSSTLTRAL